METIVWKKEGSKGRRTTKNKMEKLNVRKFAVAWGVSCAIGVLLLGWVAIAGWGTEMVNVMSSVYIGYSPSFFGAIIGAVWAFFDGAIGGAIIAWIYNTAKK